jgi:solute carrier family 25 (mitochondrial carnitine/acylcarnitine transporter), member 20/29
MSPDFWAGYVSGAIGICVGNPLDVVKVQLQAGRQASVLPQNIWKVREATALLKGMLLHVSQ